MDIEVLALHFAEQVQSLRSSLQFRSKDSLGPNNGVLDLLSQIDSSMANLESQVSLVLTLQTPSTVL